jgi:rhamnosyltransferase subunit B
VHALLVPCGRHGDVHPFLAPGRALRARGHRVTLLINGYFGPLVRRLGFAAAPPG